VLLNVSVSMCICSVVNRRVMCFVTRITGKFHDDLCGIANWPCLLIQDRL
jgi:hypothetical protein